MKELRDGERKRLADGENQGNVERLELDKDKYHGREESLGIQKVLFIELNACSGRIIQHHNDNRKCFYPKSIYLLRILPLTISLQFFLDFY